MTGPTTLESLFREHYLDLVRLAKLWLGDVEPAEDVVQDVFASLDLAAVRAPGSYLRQAVVNRSRSVLRHRAVERRSPREFAGSAVEHSVPSVAHSVPSTELIDQRLAAAIRKLPARQRDVLILRFYLDWSVERTAEFLHIRPSAVKASTYRAVHALRAQTERVEP